MILSQFRAIPLAKRIPLIDPETGDLSALEVRRDPASGLTLAATIPYATEDPADVVPPPPRSRPRWRPRA